MRVRESEGRVASPKKRNIIHLKHATAISVTGKLQYLNVNVHAVYTEFMLIPCVHGKIMARAT